MSGGAAGLDAATLVDGDVHDDRAGLHGGEHRLVDELGGPSAGDEDRADDEVGPLHHALDVARVGVEGLDLAAEDVLEVGHPRVVDVEDGHVGAHADGDGGRVGADDAAAEDGHAAATGAGDATEEDALTAVLLLEAGRAHLDGHPAGHLAHRAEQGQGAVGALDGLVGDGPDLVLHERLGVVGEGRQVEVGVEDQAGAEVLELAGQRLLDLHHHVGGPGVGRGRHDGGARRLELLVRDAGADTGVLLDQDLVAVAGQLEDAAGVDADPVLALLDFRGDTDLHVPLREPPRELPPRQEGRPEWGGA